MSRGSCTFHVFCLVSYHAPAYAITGTCIHRITAPPRPPETAPPNFTSYHRTRNTIAVTMGDITGLEDLFPRAKDVPAKGEVYRQVHQRLKQLAEVRALVRNTSKNGDDLLREPPYYLSEIFQIKYPDTPFRLDVIPSSDQIKREIEQAQTWLLQTITLQARHLPREHMIRILRFALEKPESDWNDIDKLYMALTDAEESDAEDRLDFAFALVLHYRYAETYAPVLRKLQEHEQHRIRLERQRSPTGPSQEAIRARISQKVQSVKVDNFACAIPVSSIVNTPSEEERGCPVCRNDYLDFASFDIADLIADYPVKIKYCGHVIGKSCLETWMDTPLADPAKYPHRTCPLCRTEIEGVDLPTQPDFLRQHVDEDRRAVFLADRLGLEDEECWDGLLRLMSEEIVLEELLAEVEGKLMVNGEEQECLAKAKTVLKDKLKELGEEKGAWGFSTKEAKWAIAKKAWANLVKAGA
ncbi:hypothetical protein BU23DRAFT_602986 [Bimuria novae-zelandiae CBS 107.79]|uniref:RING-type domain-containing protein n=1 Tax=Bimuria novae-zelandiae CBS 107.79 TaxID=1447943 RepID=A0A6A5URI0_9PLEO|nr:hypothetical protein BU23DRAFT_602986 [Bimuria novae-zelandiae CBS 107.79]